MMPIDSGRIYAFAAVILPLIAAIICHEVAHGLMARTLGDRTAADAGRLTLNPLSHIDPLGTLFLPIMLWVAGAPIFGWAKPVPVTRWRLRNWRWGMAMVAAAGPGTNLVLGLCAALALGVQIHFVGLFPATLTGTPATSFAAFLQLNLVNFLSINLFLALFNLLPIPPFDGSHIAESLLPERWAERYAQARRYGMALVLILVVVLPMVGVNVIAYVIDPPYDWLFGHFLNLADWAANIGRG